MSTSKLFYLGPRGSFSSRAAHHIAKQGDYEATSCANWREVWQSAESDQKSVAVVPIENSITSNVHANIDVIFEGRCMILSEVFLNIQLSLFAKAGTSAAAIRYIYSHPQALAQARSLAKKYDWQLHETASTTNALHVVEELDSAHAGALAPSFITSTQTSLKPLIKKAQDVEENQTRFVVVSCGPARDQRGDKATILLEAAHEVGSLGKLLNEFSRHNFNLTKIESRPIPSKTWVYQFWIDIALPETFTREKLSKTLDSIQNISSYQLIGLYAAGNLI